MESSPRFGILRNEGHLIVGNMFPYLFRIAGNMPFLQQYPFHGSATDRSTRPNGSQRPRPAEVSYID
jgi:hypothetical protein